MDENSSTTSAASRTTAMYMDVAAACLDAACVVCLGCVEPNKGVVGQECMF